MFKTGLDPLFHLFDEAITDKDELVKVKAATEKWAMDMAFNIADKIAWLVDTQFRSQHWLVANWMPIMCMMIGGYIGTMEWLGRSYNVWFWQGMFAGGFLSAFVVNLQSAKALVYMLTALKQVNQEKQPKK
jgi:hypothetical protein